MTYPFPARHRHDLKELGLTEIDMDRAMYHLRNGTAEFRKFLGTGGHDFEVVFARWLKENVAPGVSNP